MARHAAGRGRGPVGVGSEYAPMTDPHSTVPQGSAGSGEPYVPTKEPEGNPGFRSGGGSEQYPYPHALGDERAQDAGRGDTECYTEEKSTVKPESAGEGWHGPRDYNPNMSTGDGFMDYTGGDGGDYRNNVPYETDPLVPTQEWSPNYGHSNSVTTKGTLESDNVDLGDWDSPGTLAMGYAKLELGQADSAPDLPDGEQYPCPEDKSYGR